MKWKIKLQTPKINFCSLFKVLHYSKLLVHFFLNYYYLCLDGHSSSKILKGNKDRNYNLPTVSRVTDQHKSNDMGCRNTFKIISHEPLSHYWHDEPFLSKSTEFVEICRHDARFPALIWIPGHIAGELLEIRTLILDCDHFIPQQEIKIRTQDFLRKIHFRVFITAVTINTYIPELHMSRKSLFLQDLIEDWHLLFTLTKSWVILTQIWVKYGQTQMLG